MNSLSNPLMKHTGLPDFDHVKPEDFVPTVKAVFARTEEVLKEVEQKSETEEPTWENLDAYFKVSNISC